MVDKEELEGILETEGLEGILELVNGNRKLSQRELLINHFDNYSSITNVEAQAVYKIRALPRRIFELKERDGYSFEHKWCRDATGQRFMKYIITFNPNEIPGQEQLPLEWTDALNDYLSD